MFQISTDLQQYVLFCTDLSVTLESIPEDLSAAGEINGEYLKMAKKGGRKGTYCVNSHHSENKKITISVSLALHELY